MIKSAYNETWLCNLMAIKETKRWLKQNLIGQEQFAAISAAYPSSFYHPNFIIRILLFLATLLALAGISGFLALFFIDGASKEVLSLAAFVYGVASFFVLEKAFIQNGKHYKSGVTEAVLYHAVGFTIAGASDFNEHVILWTCLFVFSFAAIRYLDLICTPAAVASFAGILFYECYDLGGIFQQIIPFAFILVFTPVYVLAKRLKTKDRFEVWGNNLLIIESLSLLLIYAGGNYLVVRELSVSMMGLEIREGSDIPFAFIFYALTVLVPVAYLYFGIKRKDVVLLRVSLIVIAFSAFTFKYYFSLGHPEITLTIAGLVLLAVSISLLNYLKIMRHGFTRENLLTEKWGNMNVEAFVISQTMGGNQVNANSGSSPGGGDSGGGGASSSF
jgi:hypothetical protein